MPLSTSRYRPVSTVPAISESVSSLVNLGGSLEANPANVAVSAHVQVAGVILIVLLAAAILYARSLS